MDTALILHNIRSALNVGSMFRTAEAAGISRIYLTGYSSRPTDRFSRIQKQIAKTALGAELNLAWLYKPNLKKLILELKKKKYKVFALEQDERSVDYKKVKLPKKSVIIVGNEVRGIEKGVLEICDQIIEIPIKGKKESLNVAVALGVALFRILNV